MSSATPITINIQLLNGTIFPLTVYGTDTVLMLKNQIMGSKGIPTQAQKLMVRSIIFALICFVFALFVSSLFPGDTQLNGVPLQPDTRRLYEWKIKAGDTIYVKGLVRSKEENAGPEQALGPQKSDGATVLRTISKAPSSTTASSSSSMSSASASASVAVAAGAVAAISTFSACDNPITVQFRVVDDLPHWRTICDGLMFKEMCPNKEKCPSYDVPKHPDLVPGHIIVRMGLGVFDRGSSKVADTAVHCPACGVAIAPQNSPYVRACMYQIFGIRQSGELVSTPLAEAPDGYNEHRLDTKTAGGANAQDVRFSSQGVASVGWKCFRISTCAKTKAKPSS
jgi:Ubiquitin family